MKHWKKEGIKFEAIYTGYLGSTKQIEYVENIMNDPEIIQILQK